MMDTRTVTADQWQDAESTHHAVVAYFEPGEHEPGCSSVSPPGMCRCARNDRVMWQAVAEQHAPEGVTDFHPCGAHMDETIYWELAGSTDCGYCRRTIRLMCTSPACDQQWPCMTAARLIAGTGMISQEAVDRALGRVAA